MAEKEHIKGYSKDQALAKANEGTPFEKQNTATPQTPPVPEQKNQEPRYFVMALVRFMMRQKA